MVNEKLQGSNQFEITVNTPSIQILPRVSGSLIRTQLVIQNTSTASQTITIRKSDLPAVVNQGIVLIAGFSYVESTDGGYLCYQGAVQAISDAASGNLSMTESFIER